MTAAEPRTGWMVELDQERCTLCEGCVRGCPTGALVLERGDCSLSLVFDATLCHGCPDGDSCEVTCPEEAISLSRGASSDGPVTLVESPLITCSGCAKTFAAAHKLDALARAGRVHHKLVRDLCPVCRREQLVVSFIEHERVPGSKAEYRSTVKILREAGKLREDS